MSDVLERLKTKAKDHGFSIAVHSEDDTKSHILVINNLTKKKVSYTVKTKKVKNVEEYTSSIINHAVRCLK